MNVADLNLEFEQVNRYSSFRNDVQVTKTKYLGVCIYERAVFPFNVFRDPSYTYTLDLILPMSTKVQNGKMSDDYYTPVGTGSPEFQEMEDAIKFIINFKENGQSRVES